MDALSTAIVSYIIKWAVPFVCAGLFALFVKPLFDTYTKGYKVQSQADWDQHSQQLLQRFTELESSTNASIIEINKKLDGFIVSEKKDTAEMKEQIGYIGGATRHTLLKYISEDGIKYINDQHSITPLQLASFRERYDLYKKLGGDGYADEWMTRVATLPVQEPVVPHI